MRLKFQLNKIPTSRPKSQPYPSHITLILVTLKDQYHAQIPALRPILAFRLKFWHFNLNINLVAEIFAQNSFPQPRRQKDSPQHRSSTSLGPQPPLTILPPYILMLTILCFCNYFFFIPFTQQKTVCYILRFYLCPFLVLPMSLSFPLYFCTFFGSSPPFYYMNMAFVSLFFLLHSLYEYGLKSYCSFL